MKEASHPLKAAFWMMGALSGFSAMAVAARKLADHLDTFEILGYRSFFGLLIVVAVALYERRWSAFSPRAMPYHIGRNLGHFAGQNLWLFALPLIPLAQLFALEFSYPILVGLGATVFLGEKMTPLRALTAAMGFVGILIVARPFGENGFSIGILAAMACALGFAASALFTKTLTSRARVPILTIMFWMTALQLLFGLVCAFADGEATLLTWSDLPWILVVAASGLGAHFCMTTALSLAPASVVAPIDFLRLPLIAVIGMLFYSEGFDLFVFLGASIIFASIYINILSETRRNAAQA